MLTKLANILGLELREAQQALDAYCVVKDVPHPGYDRVPLLVAEDLLEDLSPEHSYAGNLLALRTFSSADVKPWETHKDALPALLAVRLVSKDFGSHEGPINLPCLPESKLAACQALFPNYIVQFHD